jgi:hypothetical protein
VIWTRVPCVLILDSPYPFKSSQVQEIDMSTSTSLRRRPHCHKCGSPMQGHRRKNGTFVCPGETSIFTETVSSIRKSHSTPLPSPPASPGGSPRASPPPSQGFSPVHEKPIFNPPPGKRWHWRNPNWVSPPRKMRLYTPSDWERGSLTPTEPVTDPIGSQRGTHLSPNVIREEEEEGNHSASWSKSLDEEDNGVPNEDEFEYFHRHSHSLSPRAWSPFSHYGCRWTCMLVAIQINSRGLALRNGNERSPPILCFYVPYALLCKYAFMFASVRRLPVNVNDISSIY